MPHDEWGNYYEQNIAVVALIAGLVVGSILSVIFLITKFALGWPHDLKLAAIISYAAPAVIVGLIGGND